MLIQVITHDAEQHFLSMLTRQQQETIGQGVLHCAFSRTDLRVEEDVLLGLFKEMLRDHQAILYLCDDGDLLITWRGKQKDIKKALPLLLTTRFNQQLGDKDPNELFRYYDSQAQSEELRLWCKERLKEKEPVKPKASNAVPVPELNASKAQAIMFREAALKRAHRSKPTILIVEDQAFSLSLLMNVVSAHYQAYAASDAQTGWKLYLEHAPDIVFLDVEMPVIDGHRFAEALRMFDKQSYIVMVTGNNYAEDVARAGQNGAKGFIVKPFNKQKILDTIQKFIQQKKAGA